ncbi:TPA: 50S ribosomal protein L13e [Candidatus Bathyarchaeota archaeon]|nr:50S ribosomal protein L13e [Candidatus Bathyarchaeota archaeon]
MIRPVVRRPGKRERRQSRGFSRGELMGAGLTFREAIRLEIPIDKRRRTVYEENVDTLKQYLKAIRRLRGKRKAR